MRTASRRLLGALGLGLVLLAALVWLAPATWLDRALQAASRGSLALAGASGTVWRGAGTLQAILPRGRVVTLAPVRWRLQAGELPPGRLRLTVLAANSGQPLLEASLERQGLEVHTARLELPADLLGHFSPTLREADLAGRLAARTDGFRYQAGRFVGRAELEWRDAASGLSAVTPLGSYRLTLDGRADGVVGQLTSLDEPALALAGTLRWRPGQPPEVDVNARPAEARRPELAPLLRILGRETSPGSYSLKPAPGFGAL